MVSAKQNTPKKRRKVGPFDVINVLIMVLVIVVTFYPFWYVFVGSFSSMGHLVKNGFVLWPDGFHFESYKQVFRNNLVPTAYRNTIFVTIVGTVLSMTSSILAAYVLSIRNLPGRSVLTAFIIVTMLIGGGLIPTYLLVSSLGLINSLWALILPGMINSYNVLLMRNFFQSVPDELYDAASVDGETLIGYLFHILLPLSKASIATFAMFYAVGYWNDYFKGIVYIRDSSLWPMQTVLRQILQTANFNTLMYDELIQDIPPETLKDAMIIISVVPILCVYPFVQKYFVKGVMIGSLKG